MILAVDIGNSTVKAGLFDKNNLVYTAICPTASKSRWNKMLIDIKNKIKVLRTKSVIHAGVSSVVPGVDALWRNSIKRHFNIKPVFISGKIPLPIKLKVDNPLRLGADRICNAAAGYELFKHKENVIAIDLGTAATYDVVLKNGDYIGGAIAPGIETSALSLNLKTSKLPLLNSKDFKFPASPVGRSTIHSIRSGLMYSGLDSMEGMIGRIQRHLHKKFKIILTGGLAGYIYKKSKHKIIIKNHLVLYGINYILRHDIGP